MNNTDTVDTANYITPQPSELQDLWHYATAIVDGRHAAAEFGTGSLQGRLWRVDNARECIDRIRIPSDNILHPSWDDVTDHLRVDRIDTEAKLVLVGQKLLDLVNAECARQGIEGRTGRPSHTDEA